MSSKEAPATDQEPSGDSTVGDEKTPRVEEYGGSSLPDGRHGVILHGWRIESVKKPMLSSAEMERWEQDLNAFRLPEMVFGHSRLQMEHTATGATISVNALDALKDWKAAKLPPVKVPAAVMWAERKRPSQEAVLDYDYTFTTPYKGTLSLSHAQKASLGWKETAVADIDWALLKRRDPILFFDEIILYEDELADSGIASLSIRARVMPHSWFALMRFWLRVDGSLMRAYETRFFCRFASPFELPQLALGTPASHGKVKDLSSVVVREYSEREETFQALAAKGLPHESAAYQQPDGVVQRLPLRKYEKSVLTLPGSAQK